MDPVTGAVIAIIGAAAGGGVGVAVQHWLRGRKRTIPVRYSAAAVVVAVAEVGKTTFIRQLLGDPDADPSRRTRGVRLFERIEGVPEDPQSACAVSVLDYDGSDLGTLTRALVDADYLKVPPTVLILLVDAADPQTENYSVDRVEQHVDAWTENMLDAILGMLPEVRHACLYVNKTDLAGPNQQLSGSNVSSLFDGVMAALEAAARTRGVVAGRYAGSLLVGMHVAELRELMMDHKVRLGG